jgi:hypothetical protein
MGELQLYRCSCVGAMAVVHFIYEGIVCSLNLPWEVNRVTRHGARDSMLTIMHTFKLASKSYRSDRNVVSGFFL